MIIDKRQLDNLHWILMMLDLVKNQKESSDDNKVTLALYDKYYSILLNVQILLCRGLSDEKLESAIYYDKHYLERSGNLRIKTYLEAAEIEMKRRKENKKIEDIEVKIPFYFDPDFDWQRFNRTFSDEEKQELRDLLTFLTKLSKQTDNLYPDGRGLCSWEKIVYENAMYALYKGTGLSVEEIMSIVSSDEIIAKK